VRTKALDLGQSIVQRVSGLASALHKRKRKFEIPLDKHVAWHYNQVNIYV
jgi:hypothetical protein